MDPVTRGKAFLTDSLPGRPNAGQLAGTRDQAARQAMGRLADFGTIEAGKIADLVVLSADPTVDIANARRIELVVRAGVVHRRRELEC